MVTVFVKANLKHLWGSIRTIVNRATTATLGSSLQSSFFSVSFLVSLRLLDTADPDLFLRSALFQLCYIKLECQNIYANPTQRTTDMTTRIQVAARLDSYLKSICPPAYSAIIRRDLEVK